MSELLKHSFSITEDDIIFVNGIELPQRNVFELMVAGRIQMQNLEKERDVLRASELKFLNMIKYDINTLRSGDALQMVFNRIKKLEGGEG